MTARNQPTDTSGYATVRVLRAHRLTPSIIRVIFENLEPERLVSSGVPDEIVHLHFPTTGEVAPPPMTWVDGVLGHHEQADARESRNYTVREWDGDRITIDFVDHGIGVAVNWARSAIPGQCLGMWGTRAWYAPPRDTEWMLLIADLPGLPALCRILEGLPLAFPVHAFVEVGHPTDMIDVASAADLTIHWRTGGNGSSPSTLSDVVSKFDVPGGRGYLWFAGEASAGRSIRKQFREVLPKNRQAIVGYWRDDKEAWLAKYSRVSDALLADYTRVSRGTSSEAEAELHWDEILERAGL